MFGQLRVFFNDDVQWYFKALGNRRESRNQSAPEPIFLGPEGATGNPLADNIVISAANPYNPFGFALDSSSNLIMIGRRPVEGGPRIFEQRVDTDYFASGFIGTFETSWRTWYWDVNAMYSRSKAEQTNTGSYDIYNIALALGDLAARCGGGRLRAATISSAAPAASPRTCCAGSSRSCTTAARTN